LLTKVLHRIIANPWVFDHFQNLMGREKTLRRLKPYLAEADGRIVLDIGGGTGILGTVVPPTATYISLDNDLQKHEGFKRKWPSALAIQGDATSICFQSKSVDYALCIALTHHLTDEQLPLLFKELARVVKRKLVFLDAVLSPGSMTSALLWRYDRGAYPRSAQALKAMIELYFEIEQIEHYTIQHSYILCTARPLEV
jgi:ubiquinone/menaquinone biosynthesis C-methylase UbiE